MLARPRYTHLIVRLLRTCMLRIRHQITVNLPLPLRLHNRRTPSRCHMDSQAIRTPIPMLRNLHQCSHLSRNIILPRTSTSTNLCRCNQITMATCLTNHLLLLSTMSIHHRVTIASTTTIRLKTNTVVKPCLSSRLSHNHLSTPTKDPSAASTGTADLHLLLRLLDLLCLLPCLLQIWEATPCLRSRPTSPCHPTRSSPTLLQAPCQFL